MTAHSNYYFKLYFVLIFIFIFLTLAARAETTRENGKVIEVLSSRIVYIDYGEIDGTKTGDLFTVYDEDIIDKEFRNIGILKVIQVFGDISTAEITSDEMLNKVKVNNSIKPYISAEKTGEKVIRGGINLDLITTEKHFYFFLSENSKINYSYIHFFPSIDIFMAYSLFKLGAQISLSKPDTESRIGILDFLDLDSILCITPFLELSPDTKLNFDTGVIFNLILEKKGRLVDNSGLRLEGKNFLYYNNIMFYGYAYNYDNYYRYGYYETRQSGYFMRGFFVPSFEYIRDDKILSYKIGYFISYESSNFVIDIGNNHGPFIEFNKRLKKNWLIQMGNHLNFYTFYLSRERGVYNVFYYENGYYFDPDQYPDDNGYYYYDDYYYDGYEEEKIKMFYFINQFFIRNTVTVKQNLNIISELNFFVKKYEKLKKFVWAENVRFHITFGIQINY